MQEVILRAILLAENRMLLNSTIISEVLWDDMNGESEWIYPLLVATYNVLNTIHWLLLPCYLVVVVLCCYNFLYCVFFQFFH